MDTHKARVAFDQAKCSPCADLVCVGSCPQGILEVGKNKKPQIVEEASCNLCGVCASLCPSKAITVKKAKPVEK